MELDLQTLLQGKQTSIKGKDYFQTAAYVEPFLERMSKFTDDFRVQVKLPDQITREDDLKDITYNRVIVQAVLPEELIIDHSQVVAMVYGLDVRKPVAKFYSGALDAVCTNLCVFGPDQLSCQEIEPETALDYKPLNSIIDNIEKTVEFIRNMQNTAFDCSYQNTSEQLGNWIKRCMNLSFDRGFGKVKLSTSTPIDAYKLLFEDDDSRYLVKNTSCNMYNVYGAFTQIITDSLKRDVMNQFEKSYLVKQIIGF